MVTARQSSLRYIFENKKKHLQCRRRRSLTKKKMREHYKRSLQLLSSRYDFLESPPYHEIYELRTRHQKEEHSEKRKRTILLEKSLNSELDEEHHQKTKKSKIKEISKKWSENDNFMDSPLFHKMEEISEERITLMDKYREDHRSKMLREIIIKLKRLGLNKDDFHPFKSNHYMLRDVYKWLTKNNVTCDNPLPKRVQCQVCFQENARGKQFLNGSIGGVKPQNDHDENDIHLNCPFKSCPGCLKKYLETSIDNNRIVIRCPGVHEDGKRCSHIFTRDDIASFVTEEHLNRWLEARTVNYQQRLDDILASDTPEREFVQTLCKPGPRCRVIVFKDEGCDDMTCTCGTNFCYLCGETICTCR